MAFVDGGRIPRDAAPIRLRQRRGNTQQASPVERKRKEGEGEATMCWVATAGTHDKVGWLAGKLSEMLPVGSMSKRNLPVRQSKTFI